jgi:hypothetical protein
LKQRSASAFRLSIAACALLALGAVCPAADQSNALQEAVARAVAARHANEAKALLIDPHLDQSEVQLLTDEEIDAETASLAAVDKSFPREPSPSLVTKAADPLNPEFRYRYWIKISDDPVRGVPAQPAVDTSLPPLQIHVDLSDPKFPAVRVDPVKPDNGVQPLYYFEFDTSPSFSSPNFWGYPALQTFTGQDGRDLTSRSGLALDLFSAMQRGVDGRATEVRFPFRATAMRLPDNWSGLTYDEMVREALALGYGLSPLEAAHEVQRYAVHNYLWGDDSLNRSAIDTFRAGLGQCGALNNLVGTLLELNGIRYRIVAGFNPKYRVFNATGGHTAIEVYDPRTRTWSYVDAYLDLFLPGRSAQMLAEGNIPESQLRMTEIKASRARSLLGSWMTISSLFKYRTYGDGISRLPTASMLQLQAGPGESEYGRTWALNAAEPQSADSLFPERTTIYVRARYVLAGTRTLQPIESAALPISSSEKPVVSPWAVAKFEIEPRALMASYPPPKKREQRNPCEMDQDLAQPLMGPFKNELGYSFTTPLGLRLEGDNLASPLHSSIIVCENTTRLGPAHALHDDIRTVGRGNFSHWESRLIFSTSDNSDPNTNGRKYSIIDLDLVRARTPEN